MNEREKNDFLNVCCTRSNARAYLLVIIKKQICFLFWYHYFGLAFSDKLREYENSSIFFVCIAAFVFPARLPIVFRFDWLLVRSPARLPIVFPFDWLLVRSSTRRIFPFFFPLLGSVCYGIFSPCLADPLGFGLVSILDLNLVFVILSTCILGAQGLARCDGWRKSR